jgi:hypothetical protein
MIAAVSLRLLCLVFLRILGLVLLIMPHILHRGCRAPHRAG